VAFAHHSLIRIRFMLKKKFISSLKKDYDRQIAERRQIISRSNIILHDSKRVIFSLHRGDVEKANESLDEITKNLIELQKKFGVKRSNEEGSYRAAVEEYVEARLFRDISAGTKADFFTDVEIRYDSYLGGLCDTTGELVRRATNLAASGDRTAVEKIKKMISDIMQELVEFDMTGYMRTKYDQARGNLRKIEQMAYDISLRE